MNWCFFNIWHIAWISACCHIISSAMQNTEWRQIWMFEHFSLPLLHSGTKHPLLCQLGVRFSLRHRHEDLKRHTKMCRMPAVLWLLTHPHHTRLSPHWLSDWADRGQAGRLIWLNGYMCHLVGRQTDELTVRISDQSTGRLPRWLCVSLRNQTK